MSAIKGVWKNPTKSRCGVKVAYPSMDIAEAQSLERLQSRRAPDHRLQMLRLLRRDEKLVRIAAHESLDLPGRDL